MYSCRVTTQIQGFLSICTQIIVPGTPGKTPDLT